MPREARTAANEAAAMPFPNEETTPPVTKTNLVMGDKFRKFVFYWKPAIWPTIAAGFACPYRALWSHGDSEAGGQPRSRRVATEERQDGVDRRRFLRGAHQHAHGHHDLRGFQLVPRGRRLHRGDDGFARPVERREFAQQFIERRAIRGVHLLGNA